MGKSVGFTPDTNFVAPEGSQISARERCRLDRKDWIDAPESRCPALARVRSELVSSALRDQGQRGEGLRLPRVLYTRASKSRRHRQGMRIVRLEQR